MIKDFILVGIGSFVGGGMRFLVSKWVQSLTLLSFPFGTFAVNVLGCLIIGFLSGQSWSGSIMTPNSKLILTTGFCGGFTTFSTFMNESSLLMKDENYFYFVFYLFGSLALGLLALLFGHWLAIRLL